MREYNLGGDLASWYGNEKVEKLCKGKDFLPSFVSVVFFDGPCRSLMGINIIMNPGNVYVCKNLSLLVH